MGILHQSVLLAADRARRDGVDPAVVAAYAQALRAAVVEERRKEPVLDEDAAAMRVLGRLHDPLDALVSLATLEAARPAGAPPTAAAATPAPRAARDGHGRWGLRTVAAAIHAAAGFVLGPFSAVLGWVGRRGSAATWTPVAALALLLVAGSVFGWTTIAGREEEALPPTPTPRQEAVTLYGLDQADTLRHGDLAHTFTVAPGTGPFLFEVERRIDVGCVSVRLTDPDGVVRHESASACASGAEAATHAAPGAWRVEYAYSAFTGRVAVSAVVPPG